MVVAKKVGVSVRRVNQLWKQYQDRGKLPVIGENVGRPKNSGLTEEQKALILSTRTMYKKGARRLEKIMDHLYGIHIPHNAIHHFLIAEGLAKPTLCKQKRRRWIRYERKHSLSAVHMDWYETQSSMWVCAVEDDASRKILAGEEYAEATTDHSINLVSEAMRTHGPIDEVITDHGTQFTKNGEKSSRFEEHLKSHGTKLILCRIKHPQSNGKIEKWFDLYNKYRSEFSSFKAFMDWYNNNHFHESLDCKEGLRTPAQAFYHKLRPEHVFYHTHKVMQWL
jgi:putative transposase